MDGITLLREAADAGLTVHADGDKLVIRGPKAAAETARKLIDHKAEIMAVLNSVATVPEEDRWWEEMDFDQFCPSLANLAPGAIASPTGSISAVAGTASGAKRPSYGEHFSSATGPSGSRSSTGGMNDA